MAITQDQRFTNNATTTVPSTISNVATSITVSTGTGALFPTLSGAQFFLATIVNTIALDPGFGQLEIVRVTARTGDVLTVVRGQDGTTAKSFPAGCVFELRPTAGGFNEVYNKMIATAAPLDSPALTGNPTAPTPSPGDNDTSIATTAFVTSAITAAAGKLINVRVITSTQAYTPTAGTVSIVMFLVGGGGGGSGCNAPGASQASSGAGGGAGGVSVSRFTSGFSGSTITIGAGGAGGAGTSGGAGSASTFLGMTAGGGSPGAVIGNSGVLATVPGGAGGTASGGNLYNFNGAPGSPTYIVGFAAFQSQAGNGASGLFGSGGRGDAANSGNAPGGSGFGAGGAGTAAGAGAGPYSGGGGSAGVAIIYEYS